MKCNLAIETSGLAIGYSSRNGNRNVLNENLNLRLYPGEVTCLLGLNGAGKSTLLRTLCGFQPPLEGEVFLTGRPLSKFSPRSFALTVGVVLTGKTNAGGITVYDLVSLGRHPYTGFFGQLKEDDKRAVRQAMEDAGITHKASSYVSELSDGERQKAMIAKSLAQECPVIILDEPTAFLDVASRMETMALLRRLAVSQGKTFLLSTHDFELAIQMGDRLWLQEKYKGIVSGTPEDLILSGAFESFFKRGDMMFDGYSGKLKWEEPASPAGVVGDRLTVRWVGNALMRNGYKPSPASTDYLSIECRTPDQIIVYRPGKELLKASSVAGLVEILKQERLTQP